MVRGGMLHRAWTDSMMNRTEACECVYLLLIKVHEAPSPSPEKNKETGRIICTGGHKLTSLTHESPENSPLHSAVCFDCHCSLIR